MFIAFSLIKYKEHITGKTKWITKSGFARKVDAERFEEETKARLKENIHLKTEKRTFDDVFQIYIVNDPFTKETTKFVRKSVYNKHLKDTIGKSVY